MVSDVEGLVWLYFNYMKRTHTWWWWCRTRSLLFSFFWVKFQRLIRICSLSLVFPHRFMYFSRVRVESKQLSVIRVLWNMAKMPSYLEELCPRLKPVRCGGLLLVVSLMLLEHKWNTPILLVQYISNNNYGWSKKCKTIFDN